MRLNFNNFSYGKNILAAFSGTAIAQAITIAGSLIIARIYAPESFGLFASWLSITQILTGCLSHMLEHALGLETEANKRTELVAAAVWVALGTAVSIGIAILIVYSSMQLLFGTTFGDFPLMLLCLLIPQSLGAALSLIWQSWAANNGNLRHLAQIRISQAVFIVSLQILAGMVKPDAVFLAAAQTLGVLCSVAMCCAIMPLRKLLQLSLMLNLVRHYWCKYRRFPLLALPASLAGVTADKLPVLLIAGMFSTEIAGYYALVVRVIASPIALLGGAVLDVFKRNAAAELNKTKSCQQVYRRTFCLLLVLSAAITIAIFLFADDVFLFLFGQKWAASAEMTIWLLPMCATVFIASPLSYIFFIRQKQDINLMWQICLCVMTLCSFALIDNYKTAIIAYSSGYAVLNILCIVLSHKYATQKKYAN